MVGVGTYHWLIPRIIPRNRILVVHFLLYYTIVLSDYNWKYVFLIMPASIAACVILLPNAIELIPNTSQDVLLVLVNLAM